jgi:hypothetical protein
MLQSATVNFRHFRQTFAFKHAFIRFNRLSVTNKEPWSLCCGFPADKDNDSNLRERNWTTATISTPSHT